MKSSIRFCVTLIACLACLGGSVQAQFGHGFDPDQHFQQMQRQYEIHSQQWDQQYQALVNQSQQQYQQLEQRARHTQQEVIQKYRQRTGDYQSPDPVALERAMQEYYARNPQAWQQKQAEDSQMAQSYQRIAQQRARDNQAHFNNMNAIHQDKQNFINDLNVNSFNRRMHSMDVQTHQFNNLIHERADYVNPNTGQVSNLSFHSNQFQTYQGQLFYTNPAGLPFQIDPNGWGQMLDDWNW